MKIEKNKNFSHSMQMYDRYFSIEEEQFFETLCFNLKTLSKDFWSSEKKRVTDSYHADKLHFVLLAMLFNRKIFTQNYILKSTFLYMMRKLSL